MKLKRYPSDLTLFKTDNYKPQQHYRNLKSWDNFTMHVPLWTQVLDHFFKDQKNLKFLELGSGNGLCANFMLDNYNCYLDTVDMEELRVVAVEGIDYEISTIQNLKPFIDKKYQELADYTHAYKQKMVMDKEVIANKGIWTAKKRYILNVYNSEGVDYDEPKLKIMGIEAVKSSTPKACREKI